MKLYLRIFIFLLPCQLMAQSYEKVDNEVTQSSTGSRAVTFVDIDKDGWLDIFVTNGPKDGENNLLYINDGEGGFTQNTSSLITKDDSPSDGATWGDIDNDGFEDLYVVNWYGEKNFLYNNHDEEFSLSSAIQTNGYSETASWADYDKDGYLDLYITNSSLGDGSKNEFYINNGDGTFTQNTDLGVTGTEQNSRSVNWVDYDNDNDLDLFVSNEGSANEFYINDEGEFTQLTSGNIISATTNSTGSSWADYDNDGDFDLYVANFGGVNELYQNQGDGSFTKIVGAEVSKPVDNSFASAWGDIDNDGDLDLYVANGFKTGEAVSNYLYINNGDGTFSKDDENTAVKDKGWSFGAAFGDYDNDGFLDLMVANTLSESQKNSLYHNLGNDNNWLILDLEGTASNRSAIGAKVKLTATIGEQEVVQLREVSSQSCYNGQNSPRVHFGLGDATAIDQLEVIWPNGNSELIDEAEINQIMKVKETVPDGFLRADFVLSDPIYLTNSNIEITNLSIYPEDAAVTYEWDFDDDGKTDSTEPNPTVSFSEIGDYTISLTLTSGNKTSEKVKSDYLKVRATLLNAKRKVASPELLSVFPNPATDQVRIQANFAIEEIDVFTLDGRSVLSRKVSRGSSPHINFGGSLKPGLYTLMVAGGQRKEFIKFLIKN